MKYFVDCLMPDGEWKFGSILMPQVDAQAEADRLRSEHPAWLVELNPVETETL